MKIIPLADRVVIKTASVRNTIVFSIFCKTRIKFTGNKKAAHG